MRLLIFKCRYSLSETVCVNLWCWRFLVCSWKWKIVCPFYTSCMSSIVNFKQISHITFTSNNWSSWLLQLKGICITLTFLTSLAKHLLLGLTQSWFKRQCKVCSNTTQMDIYILAWLNFGSIQTIWLTHRLDSYPTHFSQSRRFWPAIR